MMRNVTNGTLRVKPRNSRTEAVWVGIGLVLIRLLLLAYVYDVGDRLPGSIFKKG